MEVEVKMDNSINNDNRNKFYKSSKCPETEYSWINKNWIIKRYTMFRDQNIHYLYDDNVKKTLGYTMKEILIKPA